MHGNSEKKRFSWKIANWWSWPPEIIFVCNSCQESSVHMRSCMSVRCLKREFSTLQFLKIESYLNIFHVILQSDKHLDTFKYLFLRLGLVLPLKAATALRKWSYWKPFTAVLCGQGICLQLVRYFLDLQLLQRFLTLKLTWNSICISNWLFLAHVCVRTYFSWSNF